jgi:hypothetical protein
VIPEFFYTPLYDEIHRFRWFSSDPTYHNKPEQKGLREKLLCKSCESVICRYERYVSQLFSGAKVITSVRNGNAVFLSGIDYRKFKLFLLSVLWRAGISRLPFFRQVRLGLHEKTLREMLVAEDPGPSILYPCIVDGVIHDGIPQFGLIVEPSFTRFEGHHCFRFLFGGLGWVFFVSSHSLPSAVTERVLNAEGRMVVVVRELKELEYLKLLLAEAPCYAGMTKIFCNSSAQNS